MSEASEAFAKLYEEQRQRFIRLLRQVPAVIEMAHKWQGFSEGRSYRAVIPADILERIKDGNARLGKSASGRLSANIHDNQTGEIIGQVSLEGISPELLSSLGQMAMQSTLIEIVRRLEVIEREIGDIGQGQIDDRVGLVDSGENLYYLAAKATDMENRRLLLTNAVAQLSEARGRLMRTLETDIRLIDNIPGDKWGIVVASLTRDIPKDIESKTERLGSTLKDILRASSIMALSCGELGEPNLFQDSWRPLEELIPKARAAREKIVCWLPDDPHSLPDKLSSLLSLADGVVQAGKQLESGNVKTIEIGFTPDEIIDGEQA